MTAIGKPTPQELNDTRWDVVIAGAGPAGSMTAHELASRGLRVLLVEKAHFPRYKICGCYVNSRAVAALSASGLGGLLSDAGAIPVDRFQAGYRGVCASIPLTGGVTLSRDRLDARLAQAAVDAGANFLQGTTARLESTSNEGAAVRLRFDDSEALVHGRILVNAVGLGRSLHGSDSKFFATPTARSRIGAGMALESPDSGYERGIVYMACAAQGYTGLARLEDGRLNVAVALDPAYVKASGGLGLAGTAILDQAGFEPVPGLADAPWRGTPLLTRRASSVAEGRCVTLGDSAGFVEPFTGEGMCWAFDCARALAPIVARALQNPAMDLASEWNRAYRSVTARSQARCGRVARALRHPRVLSVAVAAMRIAPPVAEIVVRMLNKPPPARRGITQ